MKRIKLFAAVTFGVMMAFSGQDIIAKNKSAKGTYVFDNKSAMKMFQDEMKGQNVPKEMQGFVQIVMSMFKDMKFELKLKKGGKLEAFIQVPAFGVENGKATEEKNSGTWQQTGNKVTLKMNDQDASGKPKQKDLNCELKKKQLVCSDGNKKLVFRKVK